MSYKNGKEILPPELLKELQKYIQGELIYIPKKEEGRIGWGKLNGSRMLLEMRNYEICRLYNGGLSVFDLAEKYHLSDDSIRKIITKNNRFVKK